MSPLSITLCIAAYFGLLLLISWLAGRRAGRMTFFTGDRNAPWPAVAIAMIGAAISGVTFVSVPGMVGSQGYTYLQMMLGFTVGYALIALVLIPLFYRKGLISIYGYLEERFGANTYRSGAWFFLIGKLTGAAVRFFVVCVVLQELVFNHLGLPFTLNVIVSIGLIWLYTARSGVKAVIWADVLKSFCLVMSVLLCIWFIADSMGHTATTLVKAVASHPTSHIFNFDDPMSGSYFWKQFIAGVFLAIAMNGLDQDMMQRTLACADSRSAAKNMVVASLVQVIVVALFLVLGTLLLMYLEHASIEMPGKSDSIFSIVATHHTMPAAVGALFVIGLVSAAYSAAGSALTSLTTSYTIDIKRSAGGETEADSNAATRTRRRVHRTMSVIMGLCIIAFYYLSDADAITAVYTLASYTYGPILGLFIYGMACRRPVRDRWVPAVCIAAPLLSWGATHLLKTLTGYSTGFELLLVNAAFTIVGLHLLSIRPRR